MHADASFAATGLKQVAAKTGLIAFDIPAQSLASALEIYSAITGIEVFYDAALAAGQRSTPVRGQFMARRGLEVLLRGSGYEPRVTGADMISVSVVPRRDTRQTLDVIRAVHHYDYYFAMLQTRLSQSLCSIDKATMGSGEIIFRFWLADSGEVLRPTLIASGGDPGGDRALVSAIDGLQIREPPPPGLPEPITMAIFPPSAEEIAGCGAVLHSKPGGH